MSLDSFGSIQVIAQFNMTHNLGNSKKGQNIACPAFSYISTFFDAAAAAAKTLKDHICIEFLGGEINAELSKISLGVDRRPTDFQRKYTRMWLSNIP